MVWVARAFGNVKCLLIWNDGTCRGSYPSVTEGTSGVKATALRPKIIVSADGRGVVGHAGARLVADVAEVTGQMGSGTQRQPSM